MNIFYGINRGSGAKNAPMPGEELLVEAPEVREEPPADSLLLELLSVRYRIGDGGQVRIQKFLPGDDGEPNPRFWVYLSGEELYLENHGQVWVIGLTELRGLTRSRRPKWLPRLVVRGEKHRKGWTLRHYYTLDFRHGDRDWKLLLPDWSLRSLCALTGWTVTDDGKVEFQGKKTQQMVRGMSRCGGCF